MSLALRTEDPSCAAADADHSTVSPVDWLSYLQVDRQRGAERSRPKLYYLDGSLEVMTTSRRHEVLRKFIDYLVLEFTTQAGIEIFPSGQTTLQRLGIAGAEPDESWSFGSEKETPDLVLEIALTSGGLPKLEIYRRLQVPEVWIWRAECLEVWTLDENAGKYLGPHSLSRALPGIDIPLVSRCASLPTWSEALRTFRAEQG